MNDEQRDNLDWTAFRYVAAELSAEECRAFEARLADDPAACERVARAVELVHAVRAAHVTTVDIKPAVSPGRRRGRLARWTLALSACAAAVVALVVGLGRLPFVVDRSTTAQAPSNSTSSPELAFVWSDARDELADRVESDSWSPASGIEPAPVATAEAEAVLVTPDWMLTAVVDLEGENSSDEASDAEDI
jgi:anti-sigma factor RsiW